MSTYYELRCDACDQQGGFFSRQAWGWGNANLIENHKFLMHHAACGEIEILSEHDDRYADPEPCKRWQRQLADSESVAHNAWPHGEWRHVRDQGFRKAFNEAATDVGAYKFPEDQ